MKKNSPVQAHDRFVKNFLTATDLAAGLIRNYTPPSLWTILDLDALVLESTDSVDNDL